MTTQIIEITDPSMSDSYQMIQEESLECIVVSGQILAGSKVLGCNYKQVVFSQCDFFACEFQGVTFENCVFENCNFNFTHLRNCNFKNCSFTNCNWKATTSIKSIYTECELDQTLTSLCLGSGNVIKKTPHDHTTDIYIEIALAS